MPVGTVAQAMAIDAYSKYTSTDPANNVVIMDNAAIYRTVQVNITHCCHFSFCNFLLLLVIECTCIISHM